MGQLSKVPDDVYIGGTEALQEIRAWMEMVTVALTGVHGLNVTAMRQATKHLIKVRELMGATSTQEPDDRESRWPEGEGDE